MSYKTEKYIKNSMGIVPEFRPGKKMTYEIENKKLTITGYSKVPKIIPLTENTSVEPNTEEGIISIVKGRFGFGSVTIKNSSGSHRIEGLKNITSFIEAIYHEINPNNLSQENNEQLNTIAPIVDPENIKSTIGRAKFTIEDENENLISVWNKMAEMFLKRYKFWHKSHGDLEPTVYNEEGYPVEFIAYGHAGGKYPVKIIEWDANSKTIKFWKGPSLNPPKNVPDFGFVGSYYTLQVEEKNSFLSINIIYETNWKKKRKLFGRIINRTSDIKRELNWFSGGFPYTGSLHTIEIIKSE